MRKLTKWIVCLFAVILVLACTSMIASAAGNDALSLTAPARAEVGENVTVSINAEVSGIVTDGVLVVTYDADLLAYAGASAGNAWSEEADLSLADNCKSGTVTLAFAGVDAAAKGAIIDLKFTVLKSGETTVAVDGDASRLTGASFFNLDAETTLTLRECASANFADVNPNEWYHEGVDYAVQAGYLKGMSDTSFAPGGTTTRAMLVTILYRMAGSPDVTDVENPFTDIKESDYFYNAVLWAYSNDVTEGMTKTTFVPHFNLTREQLVTFLYRFADYCGYDTTSEEDLSGYTDAKNVQSWAVDAMAWAVEKGLVTGMSATTLVPGGPATRAQIAVITMRFDEVFKS